jgi:LmbE family N-acetylglucosaminyl deacetylase
MTRLTAAKAASAVRWLGLGGGGERLAGSIAVLSPHLDDAAFSVGAGVARAVRTGADVAIVTVLAGDPGSRLPAGEWDAAAGFKTAGDAASSRRREDERACAALGARPVWLPFSDHQYARGADDDAIWAAVEAALGFAATVLVPGFPLLHDDHRWLRGLVERRGLAGRTTAYYLEQPYAAAWATEEPAGCWRALDADLRDRLAKLRAWRSYASQVALLGAKTPILSRTLLYEVARGGERLQWT